MEDFYKPHSLGISTWVVVALLEGLLRIFNHHNDTRAVTCPFCCVQFSDQLSKVKKTESHELEIGFGGKVKVACEGTSSSILIDSTTRTSLKGVAWASSEVAYLDSYSVAHWEVKEASFI